MVLLHNPRAAIRIGWWWLTGRRVRAAGQLRAASVQLPASYSLWLAIHQPGRGLRPDTNSDMQEKSASPVIAIHLHFADDQPWRAALTSVLAQSDSNWRLYLTGVPDEGLEIPTDVRIVPLPECSSRAQALTQVLDVAEAPYLIPLRADCRLDPGAVRAFAGSVTPEPTVLYADQDEQGTNGGRAMPWFKPAWDVDLFLAQDYISLSCAVPVENARAKGVNLDLADGTVVQALLWDLLHGAAPLPARRVHFVAVTTPTGAWSTPAPDRAMLVARLAKAPVVSGPFGSFVVEQPLTAPPPRVSIIVPTRDRLDLLETCVSGVLSATDYPDIELVIADNNSVEPETLAYFEACRQDQRVRIVHWPHPYNYSAVNNFAVSQTSGTYICLLNNDTEIVDPDWLRHMIAHAMRPGIGAVGARLLYPDRSIQHAGVVIGMGNAAGHAHRGLPEGNAGYFAQSLITRGATAVTAACLVVAKDKFDAVGGLDEDGLGIAYNDVDFCLKLHTLGLRNIYCAQAVLVHHESKSRGLDFSPENLERYLKELKVLQERWKTVGYIDSAFHPSLDPASETYRMKL